MDESVARLDSIAKILSGDTSVFIVPAGLSEEDKKSLLALHAAIHRRNEEFTYLEIGSHLGGSLQTFLVDPLCRTVYSIDKRPDTVLDERGLRNYKGISAETMLEALRPFYEEGLKKIRTFDVDTGTINKTEIDHAPALCFIDGEHTNQAAFKDFLFCLEVAKSRSTIFFHDAHLVFEGIEKALNYLDEANIAYYAYNLPDFVCVLEVGRLGVFQDESVLERLLMSEKGIIRQLRSMVSYREFYARLNRNPAYIFARKVKNLLRV